MLDTLRVTLALALLPQVSVLVGAGVNVMVGTDSRDFDRAGRRLGGHVPRRRDDGPPLPGLLARPADLVLGQSTGMTGGP